MQRRIGLAQALINDPDLVILDEPTSGLDPIGCREVKDLIVALARRGKTVILSSHLLADVEDVCDRVVIYYGGRVQAMGPLKDLLARPETIRITTPVLPRATLESVLETIRRETSAAEVRVDTPTQNLESYFLEVVRKARQQAQGTSGAVSGGQVAAYLRSDASVSPPADKVLERLAAPQPSATVAPAQDSQPEAAPDVDSGKLAALTSPAAVQAPSEPPQSATEPSPRSAPDLGEANKKLAALLKKD
jgi:ABC-2 type transport system ATP-binding protein